MDNRSTLHYSRDVTETVGQLVGPNGFGEMLVVDEVAWDGTRSTVRLRNAWADELPSTPSPVLTKSQAHDRFWRHKADEDRLRTAMTRQAEQARKARKRGRREERAGLSKRQYARIQKAAGL